MIYFNPRALHFLRKLPANNNKEWFNAHKDVFKNEVEKPFRLFVTDLIPQLKPFMPDIPAEPTEYIFRIYRDIRFSRDKTPYKNHISAMISPGGRKDKTTPGMYVQISGNDVRVYSGCFELSPTQREQIRRAIYTHDAVFRKLIQDPGFIDTFGEIRGEKYKKLPRPYMDVIEKQPLLANRSFYYFKKYKSGLILSPDFINILIKDYSHAVPLNRFFLSALTPDPVL